ncbi:hypothetical protein, partial [Mesorhizobium sp. M2A.F.Ca.ET.039.01.1.1]|uniref:hypothetical protein n=1 Tax=Mesorhizobium sp. M2A.F.Ca.ET.039.01.1.1 TaxID=2496746 RepID=UPI001AEC937E
YLGISYICLQPEPLRADEAPVLERSPLFQEFRAWDARYSRLCHAEVCDDAALGSLGGNSRRLLHGQRRADGTYLGRAASFAGVRAGNLAISWWDFTKVGPTPLTIKTRTPCRMAAHTT